MIAVYHNVLHDFNDKLQSTRHHPRHRKPVFRGFFHRREPSSFDKGAIDRVEARLERLDREQFVGQDNEKLAADSRDRSFCCTSLNERLLKIERDD